MFLVVFTLHSAYTHSPSFELVCFYSKITTTEKQLLGWGVRNQDQSAACPVRVVSLWQLCVYKPHSSPTYRLCQIRGFYRLCVHQVKCEFVRKLTPH